MVYCAVTMKEMLKHVLSERTSKDKPSLARFGANAAVFAASTAVDLLESKAFRVARTAVFEGKTKRLEQELASAGERRSAHAEDQRAADDLEIKLIRDALRQHKAVESGVEFAEEMLSDEYLINTGGNKLIRHLTQEHDVEYAKGLATTISDYTNAIIQVFFGDRWIGFKDKDGNPKKFMGVLMAEKSMNFINPFNVEAALRMLSETPFIGDVLVRIKGPIDSFFENNFFATLANKTASKMLLGYHVMNSREKAIEQVKTV